MQKYLEYITDVRRFSPRTCTIYGDVISGFAEFAGTELPSLQNVRGYEIHLLDDLKESPRTVLQHLSVLSGYCRFLMKKGVLQNNPVRLVPRPKQEKRLPVFYRGESMEEYFESHKGVVEFGKYEAALRYMIIRILADTGLRRAELCSLTEDSLDVSRRSLRVLGKGGRVRQVPLTENLMREMEGYSRRKAELFGASEAESPLLLTPSGRALYPVFVDRAVKTELGGVPSISGRKSPHALRHTLATSLLEDGADINSIKELLGHSSLAATQIYTHNTVERLREVYRASHPRSDEDISS